jgi:hypothetical protein
VIALNLFSSSLTTRKRYDFREMRGCRSDLSRTFRVERTWFLGRSYEAQSDPTDAMVYQILVALRFVHRYCATRNLLVKIQTRHDSAAKSFAAPEEAL